MWVASGTSTRSVKTKTCWGGILSGEECTAACEPWLARPGPHNFEPCSRPCHAGTTASCAPLSAARQGVSILASMQHLFVTFLQSSSIPACYCAPSHCLPPLCGCTVLPNEFALLWPGGPCNLTISCRTTLQHFSASWITTHADAVCPSGAAPRPAYIPHNTVPHNLALLQHAFPCALRRLYKTCNRLVKACQCAHQSSVSGMP